MHACAIEGAPVQATVAHAYACSRARVCVNACVCHVTRISTCAHASKDVRAHAPRPQSGLFPFSFPCRVNWDTTSTLPPMSRTERAHGFSSSPAHSRMLSSLRASHSTCSSVSSRPTPTSTAREGPLTAPTVSPSTDTDAYFWWWCVLGVGARDVSAVGTPRSRWSGCGRCNFRHRPRPRPRACEFLPLCACARARVHTRMACAWRVPVVSHLCAPLDNSTHRTRGRAAAALDRRCALFARALGWPCAPGAKAAPGCRAQRHRQSHWRPAQAHAEHHFNLIQLLAPQRALERAPSCCALGH